jgi:hypothetical protein
MSMCLGTIIMIMHSSKDEPMLLRKPGNNPPVQSFCARAASKEVL